MSTLCHFLVAIVSVFALTIQAGAQNYPDRVVKIEFQR